MINYLMSPLTDIRMYHPGCSDDEIRYAFHEAGHTLVCLGFGVQVDYATIAPGEGYAGQVRYLADTRGFGAADQRAIVALAGYAGELVGPFREDPNWRQEQQYRSDLEDLTRAIPGLSDAETDEWLDTAKRCIRAWPETFGNLVRALLYWRRLDWEGVLGCVHSTEHQLRDHWKQFDGAEPALSPQRSTSPNPSTQAAISTLEQITRDPGRGLSPKVWDLISRLEALQSRNTQRKAVVQPSRFEHVNKVRAEAGYETRLAPEVIEYR